MRLQVLGRGPVDALVADGEEQQEAADEHAHRELVQSGVQALERLQESDGAAVREEEDVRPQGQHDVGPHRQLGPPHAPVAVVQEVAVDREDEEDQSIVALLLGYRHNHIQLGEGGNFMRQILRCAKRTLISQCVFLDMLTDFDGKWRLHCEQYWEFMCFCSYLNGGTAVGNYCVACIFLNLFFKELKKHNRKIMHGS